MQLARSSFQLRQRLVSTQTRFIASRSVSGVPDERRPRLVELWSRLRRTGHQLATSWTSEQRSVVVSVSGLTSQALSEKLRAPQRTLHLLLRSASRPRHLYGPISHAACGTKGNPNFQATALGPQPLPNTLGFPPQLKQPGGRPKKRAQKRVLKGVGWCSLHVTLPVAVCPLVNLDIYTEVSCQSRWSGCRSPEVFKFSADVSCTSQGSVKTSSQIHYFL